MVQEVEHSWQPDPEIPQTVEGDAEFGGSSVVLSQDRQAIQLLTEMLAELKKIEYHLMIITNTDLEKGNL